MESKRIKVFIFGLNKVGKSTIVEFFREKKFIPQSPTIGVSISQLIFSNLTIEFTDVGGQELYRKEWTTYLQKPHLLMFVIDSSDRDPERIRSAQIELRRILDVRRVDGVPLLVLANKSDELLAMSRKIITSKYNLHQVKDREVVVYEVSAKTGYQMDAALNAMASIVLKDDAIEYFVNEKVREQSRMLLASYKEFIQKGNAELKRNDLISSLANFKLAKEIASNLFQLGVLTGGKQYQRLMNNIRRLEKEIEDKSREKLLAEEKMFSPGRDRDVRVNTALQQENVQRKLKKISIFLFGLDRSGKTTFVEFLKSDKFKEQTPTLGLNIAHIVLGNVQFEFNDLGGQVAFRESWMTYWKDQDVMVFMVDSSDSRRLPEARDALWKILDDPRTREKPLMLLFNKTDLVESKPRQILEKSLEVKNIKDRTIGIYEISVKQNINLDIALNFLVSIILKDSEMEKFVSKEMKRLIKNFKEMYKAYINEAKILEKKGEFGKAHDRIYKAYLIQDELFKNGFSKARNKMKKCNEWMHKIKERSF
ncbi:MAG: ADP-ribosylation factor-like protein [Promethearchaeota archaeon]